MVRIRSKAAQAVQAALPVQDTRRKRKIIGNGDGNPVSNGDSLRSSKRTRSAVLPYQSPDSVNVLTKLVTKKKELRSKAKNEVTPKKAAKPIAAKTPRRPGKSLKRLKAQASSKINKPNKPSVRRKLLKSPEPAVPKKLKRTAKGSPPLKVQAGRKAVKGAKPGRKVKVSQITPPKAKATVQATVSSKKRKASENKAPVTKDDSAFSEKVKKAKKRETKPKKGKLNPKPDLTNYEVDPTFESKLDMPFVSTLAHSRLLIRAIILNDMKLLKNLIQGEPQKIYTFCMRRSIQNDEAAIDYVLRQENKEALKLLQKVPLQALKKLGSAPTLMLSKEHTGHGSTMMFGHAMKQVSVGRGGKEGNDAFLYDANNSYHLPTSPNFNGDIIRRAIKIGASKDFIDFLSRQLSIQAYDLIDVHVPLRKGHYELVGMIISKANQRGGYGFNFLHEEALTKVSASELTPFKPVSVTKKCTYDPRFTPLHCAAINPNVEILTTLLRSMPDYNLADKDGWTVGHYAAVCCGPEPLKYLLQFGISTQAVTSTKRGGDGFTLLHAAVSAGREHNVKVLLDFEEKVAKENLVVEEVDEDDASARKRKNKNLLQNDIKYKLTTGGQNALHMACRLGHIEIVKLLIKTEIDANIPTPAKFDRVTPLMISSMYGHLDVVKVLVEAGVKVEAKDKRSRTAAHYAAMNGHAHVLSYLLRLGVNHLAVDSSGNTILHYAAAYGWYFATMLCLEAGCPPNAANHWKMTPMAIAFMKGHTGLVTVLMKYEGVDVNAIIDDSSGRTLLLDICSAGYDLGRLKFLVEDLKANPTSEDYNGNSALHLLASNEPRDYNNDDLQKKLKAYRSCVEYLIEKGCIPAKKNIEGISPIMRAAQAGSFHFLTKLRELEIRIPFETDATKNTLLHYVVKNITQTDTHVYSFFNKFCDDQSNFLVIREMSGTNNSSGLTPFFMFLQNNANTNDAFAFQEKVAKIVEIFLGKFHVNVDAKIENEKSKQTPLHLTVGTFLLPTILKYKPNLDPIDEQSQTPLVIAVLGGHQEAAEQLINAGADVNFKFKSEHQINLLLFSAMKETKSFYLIPKLIAKGADPNEVHPRTKNSILHYIARKPSLPFAAEAFRAALEAGVSPNLVNCDGRTPLHLVVNARGSETDVFYDVEDALISAGANLSLRDCRGRIPLHYAFVKIGKPTDATFFDPIELVSHLVTAMKSSGANQDIHTADVYGSTALHYSAFRGATICSSYLIQTLPAQRSIDACDNNGNTPFGLAVRNRHEGCALNFYQKDADFLRIINNDIKVQDIRTEESTIRNSTGSKTSGRDVWEWDYLVKQNEEREALNEEKQKYPILEQVVKHDWQGLLYLMIGHLQSSGIGFSTGIATALKTGRFKLALKLALKVKRKQELALESGTLFHTIAKYYSSHEIDLVTQICDQFRKAGLDSFAVDEFGSQSVIYAIINYQNCLCNILLNNEKDVMKKLSSMTPDLFGRTPFSALFWKVEAPFISSLNMQNFASDMLAAGVNPNLLCEFPIELPPYPGVRYFKKLTDIIPSNGPRYPPLIVAVICQCYSTVKWMLTQVVTGPLQINANVQDSEGRTPLMHAVRLNDHKMVKLLLDPEGYDVSKDKDGKKGVKVRSSKINPLITDKRGMTVMDHLILSPGNNCYYKNVQQILELLHQIGALNAISADLKKPLDRAVQHKRVDLIQKISTLTSIPPSKRPLVTEEDDFHITSVLPSQDITLSIINDYSEAAENMAKRLLGKELERLKEKGEDNTLKITPDPLCGLDKDNSEVVTDKNQDIPYDVLMTKVDINYGVHGLYNFYKMQLVKQPRGKEMILLFTQWGRVGQQGQFQKTPFPTEEEAIKEFTKIFKAKSGNAWEDVKKFTPVPTKYRLVRKDLRKFKHLNNCDVNFKDLEKYGREKKSSAPGSTLGILKILSMVHQNAGGNYKQRYSYGSYTSEADYHNLPLLPIDVLRRGEEILKEISEKINLKATMDKDFTGKYVEKDKVDVMNEIAKLSETFYEIIPVYGYSTEKLEPIFFDHDLRNKIEAINRLIHLEHAKSFLLAAQYHQERVNPWEYVYRCLGTKIQLLDRVMRKDNEEANLILQYIHNTGDNVNVAGIYRVERQGESERLNACGVQNRQFLWHGTSAANMLAILKQGLQVAPLGSEISGHLFGKGIYLADCFSKSQHYCRTVEVNGKRRKFMLLCEAALGKIYEVKIDEAGEKPMPSGYNSLKSALSTYEPDPESTVIWKGRTVALGKMTERHFPDDVYCGLQYNEYIIFNVDQVAVRYLIEFD